MFTSAEKLQKYCEENNLKISEATLESVIDVEKTNKEEVYKGLKDAYDVMKSAAEAGIEKEVVSMSGLTGGNGFKLNNYAKSGQSITGERNVLAMAMAMSTLEVNASMGKIVASPTAGAAGVVPAALITIQEKLSLRDEEIYDGLLTAGAIGGICAMNASISGAEGGCQAETGSAAAMAAAALVELAGGSVEQCFHAASFALMAVLGLVCDPVGGLVEFPCALRNASGVNNALISADLALAGVKSIVPFDEVVVTMHDVGNSLPTALRETALGGIAIAPSALSACETCGLGGGCGGGCD